MLGIISILFFCAAAVGFVLLLIQCGALVRHVRDTSPRPSTFPGISILKPLCGIDDDLEDSLALFAALDYPQYEVLLGVRSLDDAAFPLARAAVARWPERMRLVVQQGTPGLNPKVNQLITLATAARHELLVVSDSNSRVQPDYLREIAARLEDPNVGLVTHPVVGSGEERLGSLLDNLHMASIGLGLVGAKRVAGKDYVVGKSMALRRTDLERMGGFAVAKDVLAEDFVFGRRVSEVLGKRVCLARQSVESLSRNHCVVEFVRRYQRWSVMQRQAVGLFVYLSQLLLNPVILAFVGLCMHPSRLTGLVFLSCCALRTLVDALTGTLLRKGGFALSDVLFSPLKDLLIGWAWLHGLTHSTVEWRGTRLRVSAGTQLAPVPVRAYASRRPQPELPR